jgi:hypothetical protein
MKINNDTLTIKIENLDQFNENLARVSKIIEWFATQQIKLTEAYIKSCNGTKCNCNIAPKCITAGQSPRTIELADESVKPVRQLEKPVQQEMPIFNKTRSEQYAGDALSTFYRQSEMGKITIEGSRVLTADGEDLAKYMPWSINRKIDEERTLVSVNCYKVVSSQFDPKQKNILFQWETTQAKTNTRYVNEQTAFAFRKYY